MKATIIKSLSNVSECVAIEHGKPAYKIFNGINFDNAVLIINGKITPPDYIIKENDCVTLRILPADLTDTPWWVSTFIIPFGFLIQPIELGIKAKQQADEAERELEKIKKLTNNTDIDNRPFLRGASNTLATGKSQPYLCGRNFITPYLFSKPFYKITGTDGADQEVYTILEGGFKNIVLDKIGIGDTTIKEFTDTTPQNNTYTINDGIFANGILEVRQDGELFQSLPELNYKTVSNVLNKEIEKRSKINTGDAEPLIFDIDANAKNVEIAISFPYGLYAFDDNNDRIETQVEIIPEYSTDGGQTFTSFTFNGGNTFKKNSTKELRYIGKHEFSIEDYTQLKNNNARNILIRVHSEGNDDAKIKNDCYLYYYQSQIFDPNKSSYPAGVINDDGEAGLVPCLNVEDRERNYSCVIGLKLKATKNNQKKLTQINIIATSTARIWDGSKWGSNKVPTRNPAAIALEILTSDVHPASRYNDNEIDLAAWGALYTKCANEGIYFDYVISQSMRKNDILQKICNVCNAAIYKDLFGRISVAIDQAQPSALAVYSPNNIISITNKKTFGRRVDALRIKYIDSANDTYKENTYTVTRTVNGQPIAIDENSIIKEISIDGITTYENIVKYGRRLMAVDELRQITTTIKIGMEGVYYTPYMRVKIQDPSLNNDAQSAIISAVEYNNGLLKKITLKNPVTFSDNTKQYGVIINSVGDNGAHPIALKVSGTGTTKTLSVTTNYRQAEIYQPEKNNSLSFGELDINGDFSTIAHDFIITRIGRVDGGCYTLDLQEYNEAIYNYGVIPPYKPIINNTAVPTPENIPIDAITSDQLEERLDGINADNIQASVDQLTHGTTFTNIYKVKPIDLTLEEIINRMDDDARNASASISMSADEILLQVQSLDEQQRAFIAITKDQILAQVDDMAQELTGLINVQAGAVTALVEGGGAAGEMSLSLNLPVMITAATRAQLVGASTEAKVAAVYAKIENMDYYGIKGNASNAAVKALWDDAIAGGLLASQIILSADQIQLAGKTIYTSNKTESVAAEAQIAAEEVAENNRQDLIKAISQNATAGHTVIDGGFLKTALIDVENILTKKIFIKDKGVVLSTNYNGTIDKDGNITAYGTNGWAIDHAGKSDFVNMRALNAQITGSIESENFNPTSTTAGYKFYKDGNVARGIVPLLETYQIKSTAQNKPVFFFNRGLAASVFTRVGSVTRYTNWTAIFNILGLMDNRTDTDGFILCSGFVDGKLIQYLQIGYAPGACFISAYGYALEFYNVYEQFEYGSKPTVPVDIMF